MFFFFFKQKTAYDMRISDWSSDVCSSDLMNLYALLVAEFQAVELAGRFDFYRLNAMFFSAHVAEIYFAIIEHPIDAIIALGKPQPIVAAADLEKLSLAPVPGVAIFFTGKLDGFAKIECPALAFKRSFGLQPILDNLVRLGAAIAARRQQSRLVPLLGGEPEPSVRCVADAIVGFDKAPTKIGRASCRGRVGP